MNPANHIPTATGPQQSRVTLLFILTRCLAQVTLCRCSWERWDRIVAYAQTKPNSLIGQAYDAAFPCAAPSLYSLPEVRLSIE